MEDQKIKFTDINNNISQDIMGLSGLARLQQDLNKFKEDKILHVKDNGDTVTYFVPSDRVPRTDIDLQKIIDLRDAKKFAGNLSNRSRKRMEQVIDHWHTALEAFRPQYMEGGKQRLRKLTFITLTLISKQKGTDQEIKRNCLNTFLQWLRRRESKPLFIWKAEKQKNGNIHFHLMVDCYINKTELKKKWNSILWESGEGIDYGNYSEAMNCPSTRIESPRHIKNIKAYIAKYMTKNEKGKLVEGRIWAMSRQLKEIEKIPVRASKQETMELMQEMSGNIKSIYKGDFFGSVTVKNKTTQTRIRRRLRARKIGVLKNAWESLESRRGEELGTENPTEYLAYMVDKETGECYISVKDYPHVLDELKLRWNLKGLELVKEVAS